MKLILASQSPSRKKILKDAGFVFEVMPSDFEEDMTLEMSPHDLAVYLSQGKARSLAEKMDDAIIIAADTFGVYKNTLLGKPHTEERAREMLLMLSGDVHSMITGLTIIDGSTGDEITKSIETKIWFREISPSEIEEYVSSGEPLQKAGGYAYQAGGKKFVEKIHGSESNILGMPIEEVREILHSLGIHGPALA